MSGVLCVLFLKNIESQLNTQSLFDRLVRDEKLLALGQWETSFFECPKNAGNLLACRALPTLEKSVTLPGPQENQKSIALMKPIPNAVLLKRTLQENEKKWLAKTRLVTLAFPRSVQTRLKLDVGQNRYEATGNGNNVSFSIPSADLLEAGEIKIQLYFAGLPWFGPADYPPALVRPESTDLYLSFSLRSTFAAEFPDVLIMVFPLLLLGVSLVLDQSLVFRLLGIYSSVRGLRAWIAHILTDQGYSGPEIAYCYLACDGAIAGLLILLSLALARMPLGKVLHRLCLCLFLATVFILFGFLSENIFSFLRVSDLWSNILAASVSLVILAFGTFVNLRKNSTQNEINLFEESNQTDRKIFFLRTFSIALAFSFSAQISMLDLLRVQNLQPRHTLDWRHSILLPALIIGSLASVGSVARKMIVYGQVMRARLERLMSGSKDIAAQKSSLAAIVQAVSVMCRELHSLRQSAVTLYLPLDPVQPQLGIYKVTPEECRHGKIPDQSGTHAFSFLPDALDLGRSDLQILIPLRQKEKILAVVQFDFPKPTTFAAEDSQFIFTMSQSLAATLENLASLEHLKRLNAATARFVPNDLLKILGREDITTVQLGDQVQREMTILFLDIRAFTRLSETLTPKENFDFLNSYFKTINPIVKAHSGFIDKYIGDAILALFPERPEDALNAAIHLVSELQKFNQDRQAQGLEPIAIGIGAHTGKLMLGTIGNSERMEGTVISDAVNLASRIEGMSKFFGVSVVTSQETIAGISEKDSYLYRSLGLVRAKGSSKTLKVVEVYSGNPNQERTLKLETAAMFESALGHYYNREFALAREKFAVVLLKNPSDTVAQFYSQRALTLLRDPPSPDWLGVEDVTST